MKPMSLKELAQLAHLVGHSATEIERSSTARDKMWIGCSCGYRTTVRRTEALCIKAITHHLYGAVAEYAATGLPLPDEPIGVSLPDSVATSA